MLWAQDRSWEPLGTWRFGRGEVQAVALAPDGSAVAVLGADARALRVGMVHPEDRRRGPLGQVVVGDGPLEVGPGSLAVGSDAVAWCSGEGVAWMPRRAFRSRGRPR